MMAENREYEIKIRRKKLFFRTTSHRAEKGSMLHSGIYNRELTSSLAAGSVLLGLALLMIFGGSEVGPLHYAVAAALFVALFVIFRMYVFYKDYLEMIMDKEQDLVSVLIKGLISRKKELPLRNLSSITKGYTVLMPENPDGIKVIEKIALQHGTVIPGFGEVKEFYTVNLEFKDGRSVTVFASKEPQEAEDVVDMLRKFVGGGLAQKD